jgi:hypothetical protein
MKSIKNFKIYPFKPKQLMKFKRELEASGSFDDLMLKKGALKRHMGMKYICLIKDIEDYKRKHLKGAYAILRSIYNTEVPYCFWSRLHKMLLEKT